MLERPTSRQYQTTRSLTSSFGTCVHGAENFGRRPRAEFFNRIRQLQTFLVSFLSWFLQHGILCSANKLLLRLLHREELSGSATRRRSTSRPGAHVGRNRPLSKQNHLSGLPDNSGASTILEPFVNIIAVDVVQPQGFGLTKSTGSVLRRLWRLTPFNMG